MATGTHMACNTAHQKVWSFFNGTALGICVNTLKATADKSAILAFVFQTHRHLTYYRPQKK